MKRSALILSLVAVASLATAAFGQLPAANESSLWWDIRDNDPSHDAAGGAAGVKGQVITAPLAPYTIGQNPDPVAVLGNSANRFGITANNGGGRGAGGVLRLNPHQLSGNESVANPNGAGSGWPNYPIGPGTANGDGNAATGSLYLYMDMNDDTSGSGDLSSSVGVDSMITTGPGGAGGFTAMRNTIASVTMSVYNDATVGAGAGVVFSGGAPWNGTNAGATDGGAPPSILGTKMVRVGVSAGPVYDETLGIRPAVLASNGPFRLARLDVVAGTRNCTARQANNHADNSTYSVKLRVNNLLITRTFSSSGDAQENVRMGFNPYSLVGGVLALDTGPAGSGVNGNNNLETSTDADAAIQMRLRGDLNGDGNVNSLDVTGFSNATAASSGGTARESQIYLCDFNNTRSINSLDVTAFSKVTAASSTCP